MQALVFDPRPGRLALAGAASRLRPAWALGRASPLRLVELPPPAPPSPDWARLQVLACGICGSDLAQVLLRARSDNPLSGLVSFPHVPGHEIVARVLEPGGSGLAVGAQLVVDPWLGCRARGAEPPCASCRRGFPPHCLRAAERGPWGPGWGMHLGNVRDLPGGFAAEICAHPSQLHPLPPGLEPGLGVLADPLAVGLHAVERAQAGGDGGQGVVLVLGAGTIGLSLALAAREAWPDRELWVTTAWQHQRRLVQALGAEPWPAQAPRVVAEAARRRHARLVKPWRGGAWLLGAGVELVLDSI
ncbi:MAG: alcohol dehydrogenase catalytic domain-containing protein, partial [Candidatus Dormibacteria bacterium]